VRHRTEEVDGKEMPTRQLEKTKILPSPFSLKDSYSYRDVFLSFPSEVRVFFLIFLFHVVCFLGVAFSPPTAFEEVGWVKSTFASGAILSGIVARVKWVRRRDELTEMEICRKRGEGGFDGEIKQETEELENKTEA